MRNVPTFPSAAAALSVARQWNAGASEVSPLHFGDSCTWRVRCGDDFCVLRLMPGTHRTLAQIRGELAFIDHLAAGGVRVARARWAPGGNQVIAVPPPRGALLHAVLFDWLPGRHFEYHSPDIGAGLFRMWGETMARVHRLSRQFVAPADGLRPQWFDDAVASCSTTGLTISPAIMAQRDDLVAWMRAGVMETSNYGIIHGDFERTNFVLAGDHIGVFDFDDCCYHWFAWDIACALWAFRNARPAERSRFLGWFLEGYGPIQEPDGERMRRFSDLVRLRTIALFLYRLRHRVHGAQTVDHDWFARTEQWLLSDWQWTQTGRA